MPASWPLEEYKDAFTKGFWADIERKATATSDTSLLERGLSGIQLLARDHARTPMQWTADAPHGGFSTTKGSTWMRANDSYRTINVADQEADSDSPLAFYRRVIAMRKANQRLFVFAEFELVDPDGEETFVFVKRQGEERMVVALNFTKETQPFSMPSAAAGKVRLELSSAGADDIEEGVLRPFEARIYLPL
mgnify:FL=1